MNTINSSASKIKTIYPSTAPASPQSLEVRRQDVAADDFEAQIFFAEEMLKLNTCLNKTEQVISSAEKRYPKLKRDKAALRKAFPDRLKFEAALEELSLQSDLLKILQQLYQICPKDLDAYLTGDFSGLEILQRFWSDNFKRQSVIRDAIQRSITDETKKKIYLQLVHYQKDWRAFFDFCLQYASRIDWVKWIKVGTDKILEPEKEEKEEEESIPEKPGGTKKLSHIAELCKNIKDKWDARCDDDNLPDMRGRNNLRRRILMSLIQPESPCEDAIYAYFKVIEEHSNGKVKLLNRYWSTEQFFASKNTNIVPSINRFDYAFAIISPNPYGTKHFVLYVIEPRYKRAYLYDPLGMNNEHVRDRRAINQAITYVKSHAQNAGEKVERWNGNETIGPKTLCIELSGIYIAQFAKELSNGVSSTSFIEDAHQRIDLMYAELLEGSLIFP